MPSQPPSSSQQKQKQKHVSHLPSLTRNYEAKDYEKLCENEYFRFLNNSKKIGAVLLIGKDPKQAIQFSASEITPQKSTTPKIRQMRNIQKITPFNLTRYHATSPTGTPYYAKRFMQYKFNNNEIGHIAFFSPTQQKVFWGMDSQTPLFDPNKVTDPEKLQAYKKRKAGTYLSIKREDIPKREQQNRNPSQNGVMGHSAVDELNGFLQQHNNKLTQPLINNMQRSIKAPLYNPFFSNYRSEWLHAFGWGLTPINQKAQTTENLGSAPKWSNTEMMLLERIAKWFSLNKIDSKVSIKPKFTMLLDSDVIKHINFNVKIKWNKNKLKLSQSLDPFIQYPVFRKASDIAIATFLLNKLMLNEQGNLCSIAHPQSRPCANLTALHPERPLIGTNSLKRKREEPNL